MELINRERLEELNSGNIPVVVDFFAEWCGPCKVLSKTLDEIETEFKDNFVFVKCNIEDEEELIEEWNITNIPTLVVFEKGDEITRWSGNVSKVILRENIETYLKLYGTETH